MHAKEEIKEKEKEEKRKGKWEENFFLFNALHPSQQLWSFRDGQFT